MMDDYVDIDLLSVTFTTGLAAAVARVLRRGIAPDDAGGPAEDLASLLEAFADTEPAWYGSAR